jgi:predicted N-formylglutamate amidohydrolase
MNERLKELAEQAGLSREFAVSSLWLADDEELKHFAELVRQDERNSIRQSNRIDVTDLVLRAKAEEREAIAALVEADDRVHEKAPDFVWAKTVAKLIRARGEPSPAFKNYMNDNWAGIV